MLGIPRKRSQRSLRTFIEYVKARRGDLGLRARFNVTALQMPFGPVPPNIWRECFFNIISQPYFPRIWVIKKTFLSKKATCLLDRDVFGRDIFESCAKPLPIKKSPSPPPAFQKKKKKKS